MARRRWTALAVALAVAAGAGGIVAWRSAGAAPVPPRMAPEFETVDPSAPEARLLTEVLHIEQWREFGTPVGYTSVPATRPPGLTNVTPGGRANGGSVDGYGFRAGGHRLFAFVEVAPRPTDTCAAAKELTHAICVRSGVLDRPAPSAPDLTYVTVYLTADSAAALQGGDAANARRFWADTAMVPTGEAGWFTDLAARARAAVLP